MERAPKILGHVGRCRAGRIGDLDAWWRSDLSLTSSLSRQGWLVDAELPCNRAQLLLHLSHVVGSHPQQLLLRARQRLERRIRICVTGGTWLECHVTLDDRGAEQLDDRRRERAVEVR